MSKPTIADTFHGTSLQLKERGISAATFLAQNGYSILDGDGKAYLQTVVRPSVSTPIIDIFSKVVSTNKLKMFTMFDLSKASNVPTVLTLPEITLDGKYLTKNMPLAYQNAWINLTPYLGKRDAYNRNLTITNVVDFASLVAKGMLCMSYNDSDDWLTPILAVTIIEMYSLMFSSFLKNKYNLDFEEMGLVRTLFAAYAAQLLDKEAMRTAKVPPLLYRCKFLYQDTGSIRAMEQRFDSFNESRFKASPDGSLNIDVICKIIQDVGPTRMKDLQARTVYAFMSRSPMDSQNMLFAIDYMPYFVYLMLHNLKGGKNPSFQTMLKFGDVKRKMLQFADELVDSRRFIEIVNR